MPRIIEVWLYVERFPSQALAKMIRQNTLINSSSSRVAVFWHYRALNLFKKIRSYTLIHSTLNLTVTVTLVCVLRISVALYLISGIKSAFFILLVRKVRKVRTNQLCSNPNLYPTHTLTHTLSHTLIYTQPMTYPNSHPDPYRNPYHNSCSNLYPRA